MSTDKIFSTLKTVEYDIKHIEESSKTEAFEEKAQVSTSKYATLKANKSNDSKKLAKEKGEYNNNVLLTQYTVMAERFVKMEGRMKM